MRQITSVLPAFGIFCLALLIRIAYNLTVARGYYPLHDSLAYQTIAFHLIDEHCYCWTSNTVTVSHPPFWPFVIAGISLIAGRADIFDRLFLCFADAGTCVFIYLLARDLFDKRIGITAGLIACVYPTLYIYTGWMYTETLYTFLLIATCYCVYSLQRDGSRGKLVSLCCGVLLAALTLTRLNGILVIGLVILWAVFLYWRKSLQKRALINVGLAVLIACILIMPWTLRNYLLSHSFVPSSTGDGTVLAGSYNDQILASQGQSGWVNPASAYPRLIERLPIPGCQPVCEVAHEDLERDTAIQW